MPSAAAITARAHAKVNLALAVGPPLGPEAGPRAGFHPICSWFAALDLADEVRIEPLPPGRPSEHSIAWGSDAPRPSPIDWPLERDLAVRAHRALESRLGRALPLRLTLTKRIPVGGGLGGGSSDAASALLAINAAWALGLSAIDLAQIGAGLGSDVPFFLDTVAAPHAPPRPAIVSGLGERLERLTPITAHLVLILPSFGCPTPAVYRAFDALAPGPLRDAAVHAAADRAAPAGAIDPGVLFNDLLTAAEAVAPPLADLRQQAATLLARPVHLTGSGSTLFAIFPSAQDARLAAADLTRRLAPKATAIPARLA